MKKICICGHFGNNMKFNDGQTVKTQNIYAALKEHYGEEEIYRIDTYNWKRRPIKLLKECIKGMKNCKNILILPAHNGVRVFIPMFLFLNKLYKRKIFYIVIGGWLPEFLKNKKYLTNKMKKLDKIFVETNRMKEDLKKLKINNVNVMPNFKQINILKIEEINKTIKMPLKLCTFSRVLKEKGIEDAIEVVNNINNKNKLIKCSLDIYGVIDEKYKKEFEKILEVSPQYINYKGVVKPNRSIEIVKKYDILLFPTYYEGEGFAGTLIDAMAAGVPVIASDWKYNKEIIKDGINGFTYETHNNDELEKILERVIQNTDIIIEMKKNCVIESEKYKPDKAIIFLLKEL